MTADHMTDLGALNPPREFGGRSIVDVLDSEHAELDRLMVELIAGDSPDDRRRAMGSVLTAALSRHFSAEEQDLYPTARSVLPDGDRLTTGQLAEDRQTLRELIGLESLDPGDPGFERLLKSLDAQLQRHMHVISAELLPEFARRVGREKLVKLGNRIAMDNEAAPTRPHPWMPSTPPWNWVVGPAIGAVDKLRDVATGRKVYPEDLQTA